jgi:uncharacterized protein
MRLMTSGMSPADRFGLTWHPSIAPGVLTHLDRIDLVEVIPEGRFLESRRARRALMRLARTVPVSIHGVSLGLATVSPIDARRLEGFARLVGEVEPESWSEHLAFVRSGDIELGHLAAPPRTAATIEAVSQHVELARRQIGSYPSLENVATPLEPPGSDRSEEEWLNDVLKGSPSNLLLDLHNLHTNATNFGFDPLAVLDALPPHRIRTIHIAGGDDVAAHGGVRRVDDHLHDVPDAVYALLTRVGEIVPQAIDVVLERDGAFPPMAHLLAQLDRAREALALGRARAVGAEEGALGVWGVPGQQGNAIATSEIVQHERRCGTGEDAALVERFLARLYTDERLRRRFLAAPLEEARREGLPDGVARSFENPDAVGLELAAATFAHKRKAVSPSRAASSWRAWLTAGLRRPPAARRAEG